MKSLFLKNLPHCRDEENKTQNFDLFKITVRIWWNWDLNLQETLKSLLLVGPACESPEAGSGLHALAGL